MINPKGGMNPDGTICYGTNGVPKPARARLKKVLREAYSRVEQSQKAEEPINLQEAFMLARKKITGRSKGGEFPACLLGYEDKKDEG